MSRIPNRPNPTAPLLDPISQCRRHEQPMLGTGDGDVHGGTSLGTHLVIVAPKIGNNVRRQHYIGKLEITNILDQPECIPIGGPRHDVLGRAMPMLTLVTLLQELVHSLEAAMLGEG